ncbi:MarR family winged helix-turn-helix transcriptional regulator [Bittarella massiliensis (ex Durand et al. 2017)]|uniref:MarR family winged helix-turn-helix transcriptional regulator n=1 Tax=Bittarella massiliensis (ex Durand et al. 2017) TaxID=1720313 RepID=UPI001AA17F7C|nr:MarR family winged helix-turn-helix transcriptional regulator [Bittarella massiliensis (ex Durand et al. 2017)]MBO1679513.1 winged helix-turn-helix transcriptional regulator [Bittarella massiliensis (ex Durand et al. 2017)]
MGDKLRSIVWRINRLQVLHRIYLSRAALENGLYFGQLPILENIMDHDLCTQKELAAWMRISAPSIATSVKRLQKHELVEKRSDPEDLRCTRLHVTEKGRAYAASSRAAFDQVDERLFAGFTPQELEQLQGLLDRMIDNLGSEYRDRPWWELMDTARSLRHQVEQEEEKDG